MADDSVSVSGPIKVKSDSAESTAFELMKHIPGHEGAKSDQRRSRAYWLTLYRQCWKAAKGQTLESILKEE